MVVNRSYNNHEAFQQISKATTKHNTLSISRFFLQFQIQRKNEIEISIAYIIRIITNIPLSNLASFTTVRKYYFNTKNIKNLNIHNNQ